jgi:integrase/recombinase XerD
MNYLVEWMKERYGELSVQDVSSSLLREYILWCSSEKDYYGGHPFKGDYAAGKKGLSASSVNVRIRIIKTFFNELYSDGIINQNPATNLSLMRQEVDTVEPLNEDELRKFMKAPNQKYFAQYRDYVIMTLIVDSGMRINEICSLEKTEIDFMRKRIVLPAIKNKNRKSRILPISVQTSRLIQKLIAESEQYFQSNFVFTTNSGQELNEKTIQKAFTKYAEKAKIERNVSPHVLRHNFATMAAHNGMSVFHLMKILGHSDIKTTRKYVQVNDADLFEQHSMYSPLTRVLKRS